MHAHLDVFSIGWWCAEKMSEILLLEGYYNFNFVFKNLIFLSIYLSNKILFPFLICTCIKELSIPILLLSTNGAWIFASIWCPPALTVFLILFVVIWCHLLTTNILYLARPSAFHIRVGSPSSILYVFWSSIWRSISTLFWLVHNTCLSCIERINFVP